MARCVGMCSAFTRKLWGVFEGLKYARRLDLRALIKMHVDLAAMAKILNSGACGTTCGMALILKICRLLDMVIQHSYEEAN
jgi:hypothetical protein